MLNKSHSFSEKTYYKGFLKGKAGHDFNRLTELPFKVPFFNNKESYK